MTHRHSDRDHPTVDRIMLTVVTIALAAVVVFVMSGCAGTGAMLQQTDEWKKGAIYNLQQINDRFLTDAELMLCQGASKGALDRRYGVNSDLADSYNQFCKRVGGVVEIKSTDK